MVEGGLDKALVDQFLSLPARNINSTDHLSKVTALYLSGGLHNTNVTELLLWHFCIVDCLNNNRRTPSFVAAAEENVRNLMSLFDRGANLHLTTACLNAEIPKTWLKRVRGGNVGFRCFMRPLKRATSMLLSIFFNTTSTSPKHLARTTLQCNWLLKMVILS